MEMFIMWSRGGATHEKTSFSMDVGKASRGLEEDFIVLTTEVRSAMVMQEKLLSVACLTGQIGRGEWDGVMLDLTSATLFIKKVRKRSQSSFE